MARAKIYYFSLEDEQRKEDKLTWFAENPIEKIDFEFIEPNNKNNWINIADNDFDELIPVVDKDVKAGKSEKAIFKQFSRGVATMRDEWVYDFSKPDLGKKMQYFVSIYEKTLKDPDLKEKMSIKWDEDLGSYLRRRIEKKFSDEQIVPSIYRPFIKQYFYFDRHFNGRTYQWPEIFSKKNQKVIVIPGLSSPKDFFCYSTDTIIDLNALPAGCQCLPIFRKDANGQLIDNITDWGLEQFQNHYGVVKKLKSIKSGGTKKDHLNDEDFPQPHLDGNVEKYDEFHEPNVGYTKSKDISKEDIFHYTYAVLHNPAYRKKYELNLKREFPRLPFYENFHQWAAWGKTLMDLHINFESAKPFKLKRIEEKKAAKQEVAITKKGQLTNTQETEAATPKAKLKADRETGEIILDDVTTLSGIPKEAWEYKLGNRSALEWVLDQYKEKKPSDPTIAEKFNTYRFADYKEKVIDLLQRVCTVSVETMKVIREMEGEK